MWYFLKTCANVWVWRLFCSEDSTDLLAYGQCWRAADIAVACRAPSAFCDWCRCCCHLHTAKRRCVRTSGKSHTSPCTRCSPPSSENRHRSCCLGAIWLFDTVSVVVSHILGHSRFAPTKTLSLSESGLSLPSCSRPQPQKELLFQSGLLVGSSGTLLL